jgi:hypothetical protein
MIPFAVHTRVLFAHDTDHEKVAPLSSAIGESTTIHLSDIIVPHFIVAVIVREPTRRPFKEVRTDAGTPEGFDGLLKLILLVAVFVVFPLTPNAHQPPSSPPIG